MPRSTYSGRSIALAAIWLLSVATGFAALTTYKIAPGEAASAPRELPNDSIDSRPGSFNLVTVVHPRCPCSRATIEELVRLLSRCPQQPNVHIVFVVSNDAPEGWEQGVLWDLTSQIAGAFRQVDRGGVEAKRFGARTSGQVLLYSPGGQLLFSGGINESRGHEGDNLARQALRARLVGETSEYCSTPVFGCPLRDAPRSSEASRTSP